MDAIANLDGAWHLSFREVKPEFLALLARAIAYLDTNQTDFMHQLGGARNFGAGIVDCELVNPLYDDAELRTVFDRSRATTQVMEAKDDEWHAEYLPEFESALESRIEGESDE